MTDTYTEDAPLKQLARALKQARLVAQHKGEKVNVGCALVELSQAGELELQLGEGTFELVLDEYFARLEEFARNQDEVIRTAPHSAMVIMRGLTSQDHLELAAAKLSRLMSPPISVVNNSVLVKTNAGLALSAAGDLNSAQLYNAAHSALTRAHADQRFVVYNPKSIEEDADQWQLKVELEQALHQGEFFAYFEPVIATTYSTITAAAARMIWHSPSRGMLPFSRVAERATDCGLTRPLSWHFLKSTIGQAAHWDRSIRIIIPLEPCVFTDDEVVQELMDALSIYGLGTDRVTLEVAEVVLDQPVGRQVLEALRAQGVQIRIAQLGSGGLPLEAMGTLPADEVTFSAGVLGKQTPPKVKQAIFQLFNSAGVRMAATGVKDARVAARFRELGFSAVQGPVAGELMRSDAFTRWLKVKVGAVG
jgi:EAL domain-containing protein (putative c-di-GMP-specific phosphodiesterase class I)